MSMPTNPPPPVPPFAPPSGSAPPLRVILEQGKLGRWMGRIGWILFLLVFVPLLFKGQAGPAPSDPQLQEKFVSHSNTAKDKVAVIAVEGLIYQSEGYVKWQIDRVQEDENVKAVVLRVNSPGGTVNASDNIYHDLIDLAKKKNIPLVVSMGGLAASGGYYVSMAVGERPGTIFAEPTTWTGSIGVIIPHYDLSELLAKWDIKDDSIASHPLKQMLSMTHKPDKEWSEKERQIAQALVDDSFADFKAIVKSGRPNLSEEKLTEIATGQIFTAKQALQHGLVDQIGFLEDAVNKAINLANLNSKQVCVVRYERPMAFLGGLLSSSSSEGKSSAMVDLPALLDFTTPRAYFLFNSLPALGNR